MQIKQRHKKVSESITEYISHFNADIYGEKNLVRTFEKNIINIKFLDLLNYFIYK